MTLTVYTLKLPKTPLFFIPKMKTKKILNVLDQISFSDTTQREGRQSEGAHLTIKASMEHARLTSQIGIDYLELNHPESSPSLGKLVKDVTNLKLRIKVATHVRCNLRDVESAIKAGAKYINTYIPVKPNTPKQEIKKSLEKSMQELVCITKLTLKHNIELRVSVEHTFSLPLNLLKKIYKKIADIKGVNRIGIAETTGVCFPGKLKRYARAIYKIIPANTPIQFHLHNDHGLAAANFLEIVNLISRNGKKAVFDISLAGFGERNGILSYGDVFAILYLINPSKLKNRYKLENYSNLVKFIETTIGLPFPRRDPLNPWAFSHSAGPHLDGMVNGNNAYQIIPPNDFGFKLKLNIGHCITGYQGLQYYAKKEMSLVITDEIAKNISAKIREKASIKGPLTDSQLRQFISNNI